MRYGDSKRIALASIGAPGDIKVRTKAAHVKLLADDIAELGGEPLNHIAVTKTSKGWRLIAGRDRFAALMINGVKRAHVRVVLDATADELRALEVSENLFRRVDDRDALVVARTTKLAERISNEREAARLTGQKTDNHAASTDAHRPLTPHGEARKQVALALGVTPEAVRSAERRVKDLTEAKAPEPATPKRGAPPLVETFGRPMPAGLENNVGPVLAVMRKLDRMLTQAQGECGVLAITCCPPGVREGLRRALHEAAALVRAETPTHLCPYCYGEDVKCKTCQERGFVTRAVFEASPRERRGELFDDGPAKTPGEAMARARAAGVTVEEHAAGLDPEPERPDNRSALTVLAARGPLENVPKPKKRGMRVQILDAEPRDIDELVAEVMGDPVADDELWTD